MLRNALRNLSIMNSMVLVTSVPIAVVIALSAWIIVPKFEESQAYLNLEHLIELATDVSSLVHEQQKERGATAVFVGSNGRRFASELSDQRLETDKRRKIAVENIELQFEWLRGNNDFQGLVPELEGILSTLDEMSLVRSRVDSLTISSAEAVAYYTDLNAEMLAFVKNISTYAFDADITSAVISLAGFLQAKERAGIERAVGSGAFASGGFTAETLLRFKILIQVQDVYYSVFLADASEGSRKRFEDAMSSPAATTVQKMRDIALNAGVMGDLSGITGEDFFQAQTEKINHLKDVETFVKEELIQLMDRRQSRAEMAVYTNVIMSLLAMTLSVAAAWFVALLVRNSLVSVSDSATRMAEGDLETVLPTRTGNEIGAIIGALDVFRTSILEARKKEAQMRENERKAEEERRAEEERIQKEKEERFALERKQADELRAKEAAITKEIASVVSACAEGDFSLRMDLGDKDGAFASICEGINKIGEVTQAGLQDISQAMKALSANDLTYRVGAGYKGLFGEIAADVNASLDGLSSTMADIRASGITVGQTAEELAEGAVSLSSRTERNAATLEETSAAMTELQASVSQASAAAEESRTVSLSATGEAEKGLATVEETVSAMQAIKESSDSITKIIDLIDNIAFQTNLLALNAGVEAARAGEAGRGFAVVATEVRDLAGRSSDAAKQIAELISDTSTKIANGVELVERSGHALRSIAASIGNVSSKVQEVASSAQEQNSTIKEVTTATQQLDQSTQENAAMFEETTAAINSMKTEFASLLSKVAVFKFRASEGAEITRISQGRNSVAVSRKIAATSTTGRAMNATGGTSAAAAADGSWEEFREPSSVPKSRTN